LRKIDDDDGEWREIERNILEDRGELERLLGAIDSGPSTVRRAAAWTAEKLAEWKMRLDDSSDGALRRLELIEALALGIDGKQALWAALHTASERTPPLKSVDYPRLIARAEAQRRVVERRRLRAAVEAFS